MILNKIEKIAQDFYLEWFNDYLTINKMAQDYSITESLCKTLIDYGRSVHEKQDFINKVESNHD